VRHKVERQLARLSCHCEVGLLGLLRKDSAGKKGGGEETHLMTLLDVVR
jgi:hypothetical protein